MNRSNVILIVLVALGLGGGVYHFYAQHVETLKQEEVARQAAARAQKKQEDEARAKAATQLAANAPANPAAPAPTLEPGAPAAGDLVIGTPKKAPTPTPPAKVPVASVFLGPEPPAGKLRPPVIAAAEAWIRANKLTSVSLGNSPAAIFGKRDYQPGAEIALGGGLKMTVAAIGDGWVEFSTAEGYRFRSRSSTGGE